jgi:hypothetical protein
MDPLEVARQLTLIEFEMFSKIRVCSSWWWWWWWWWHQSINLVLKQAYQHQTKPIEFFKQAWCSKKLQHLAPNVLALINHFNRISRWTSSRIVIERKVRSRAKIMEHLIFITYVCGGDGSLCCATTSCWFAQDL